MVLKYSALYGVNLKTVFNWLVDSFIKLHQVELVIPLPSCPCCQCTIALCATQQSANNIVQLACVDHPCVHVSDISYGVMLTMLLDCQAFVLKRIGFWMLQSGPAMELLLQGFAVNINIYLHRAVGILMGGLGSLLRLWNKITWCAAVPINAVPESYISFLKNNNYLWGSSEPTLKNIIWFLLTEQLLAVIQYSIIFPHVNSWWWNSLSLALFITVICSWLFAGCEMHAVPQ